MILKNIKRNIKSCWNKGNNCPRHCLIVGRLISPKIENIKLLSFIKLLLKNYKKKRKNNWKKL